MTSSKIFGISFAFIASAVIVGGLAVVARIFLGAM